MFHRQEKICTKSEGLTLQRDVTLDSHWFSSEVSVFQAHVCRPSVSLYLCSVRGLEHRPGDCCFDCMLWGWKKAVVKSGVLLCI